jgi:hypothetical protein
MTEYLSLMADGYEAFFIFRDSLKHSGNDYRLDKVFRKFLIEGQSIYVGYYGSRLDNHVKLCPALLCIWPVEAIGSPPEGL